MNVSLIGYRGVGKTTIGEILAEKTGFDLKRLDDMIVERAGMSIPEIVERHGWDRFRDLESEVLAGAAKGDGQVLDCGGGVILREENRKKLRAAGPVVWLAASVPDIIERIKKDDQRPSLTGKSFTDEVAEVLEQREPLYRESADHVIDTGAMSPEEAADNIVKFLDIDIDPG
jgi:shikimate kinase